jgi:hypothetical protein
MTGDGDRDGPGDAASGEREEHPEFDVDAAFAAIVAGFADPLPTGAGPWPAAEDVEADAPPSGPADDEGVTAFPDPARLRPSARSPRHRLPEDSLDPADRGNTEAPAPVPGEDDEERFVPPEPPPITSTDLASRLAWLGVLGGPLVLLLAALTWSHLPTLVVILTLAAFVGGFITLVARLPRDRDHDGPDDGAVV